MRCVIRDVMLIENFDKWSDWSAIDTAGKELTTELKKIIIKFSNTNSKQGFISNTLNVRQACVRKFLKWWKCWQSVEKVASDWQTPESDWRSDWRRIRHVEAHRKKTSAEIINCVNDMLTQRLSPRMVRRRLHSCGLTRRKIWKQTATGRVN